MEQEYPMRVIARVRSDFSAKFGIPRQSGLVDALEATVVLEPEFRNPDTLRGIEGFSHLWLIWAFSESVGHPWSPTVRPPRLGGNTRMGVFATRSPFRPNPIGLSSVRLDRVELTADQGPVLHIRGADLMDGTPILDIKPYLPYGDCHPEARSGFAPAAPEAALEVVIPPDLLAQIPETSREALRGILALDPRPPYQQDPDRIYGLSFAGLDIKFSVAGRVLQVRAVESAK